MLVHFDCHMIGAIFYAIVTGTVISTLEERTEKDNKMGSDIARLSQYLTITRMSEAAKERIMKGYMMRNVLTESDAIDVGSRLYSVGIALERHGCFNSKMNPRVQLNSARTRSGFYQTGQQDVRFAKLDRVFL